MLLSVATSFCPISRSCEDTLLPETEFEISRTGAYGEVRNSLIPVMRIGMPSGANCSSVNRTYPPTFSRPPTLYYMSTGMVKNTIMIPIEVALMWLALNAAEKHGLDRRYLHQR